MESRMEYLEKLSARLREWDAELVRLKESVLRAPSKQKVEYLGELELLELRRRLADERLERLSRVSDEEWPEERGAAEQMWEEMRESLKRSILKVGGR